MAVNPLTVQAVRQLNENIKNNIQASKVDDSKITIAKLQSRGQFAANKDIISYHTSKHQSKRYEDIGKFYNTMKKSPRFYQYPLEQLNPE